VQIGLETTTCGEDSGEVSSGGRITECTTRPENKKSSFGKFCQQKPNDTVLLVGDSMVRGLGCCLEQDSGLFSKVVHGGAKIEWRSTEGTRTWRQTRQLPGCCCWDQ
jgi:hypothetical protein